MNPIIAVRYIDALYFKKKEKLNFTKFRTHVAIGKLVSYNGHIALSFTERDGLSETGLLIPKEAIILEKANNKLLDTFNFSSEIGSDIGIYWKDIVHYVNGKIPDECARMYTEGKLFSATLDAVIIKNPETVAISKKYIHNHPLKKASFIVIPKSFITHIEYYDTKI